MLLVINVTSCDSTFYELLTQSFTGGINVIKRNNAVLLFPNRISLPCNIFLKVNPEGENQINNDGRTDTDKSRIDKKQADIR